MMKAACWMVHSGELKDIMIVQIMGQRAVSNSEQNPMVDLKISRSVIACSIIAAVLLLKLLMVLCSKMSRSTILQCGISRIHPSLFVWVQECVGPILYLSVSVAELSSATWWPGTWIQNMVLSSAVCLAIILKISN